MMNWNDQTIGDLRTLWAEGHSTSEIGRRLGCSKNAVVGKSHRLDLDTRPSPIRRPPGSYIPPPPSVPRAARPTLPPMVSYVPPPALAPQPSPPPLRIIPPAQPPRRSGPACCWPIGTPGTKTFRFCGGSSAPHKPYCRDHCERAYAKIVREERAV